MTTATNSISDDPGTSGRWSRRAARLEQGLSAIGDRLNPILVKETRQALKSKQFLITFVLVLAACWLWSIIGVIIIGPSIYYGAEGAEMFYGYFIILAFPLAVIVPFWTFRSMAGEREDNTYDLLTITLLGPRQIIAGKLGSTLVQIIVYFSATAPFLAFTYILRGIDILTIGILMYYLFFGSLGLSAVALLLATVASDRVLQVLLSVATVMGLGLAFWGAIELAWELVRYADYHDDWEFWVVNAAILTAYITYFAFVFLAAAAQITFQSENRSTALRWVMMVQFVCLAGWFTYIWILEQYDEDVLFGFLTAATLHWYIMGAMMSGESPEMSTRVMRGLPQTQLGRAFLTWFNPGPGCGYVFASVNLIAMVLLTAVACLTHHQSGVVGGRFGPGEAEQVLYFSVLAASYAIVLLGLGNLMLGWLRRFGKTIIVIPIGVQLILLFAFTFIPLMIQSLSPDLRYQGYTLLQITNPFWTLAEISRRTAIVQANTVMIIVPLAAAIVFAANLPRVLAEISRVRILKPPRVVQDEEQAAVSR